MLAPAKSSASHSDTSSDISVKVSRFSWDKPCIGEKIRWKYEAYRQSSRNDEHRASFCGLSLIQGWFRTLFVSANTPQIPSQSPSADIPQYPAFTSSSTDACKKPEPLAVAPDNNLLGSLQPNIIMENLSCPSSRQITHGNRSIKDLCLR